MTIKIAINGLGRIGRLVLRQAIKRKNIEIVAVNDLVPPDNLAYLIKYDSTHGRFDGNVVADEHSLTIDSKKISAFSEKDPAKLPWGKLGVDYVVESSGVFTSVEGARKHLEAGARRVIITAPAKERETPTFVLGVNEKNFNPSADKIISNASCTTNCLALIVKVLLDNFGIEEGLMTTIHAMTASQPTVDGASKKDWRGGRGAGQNIIPASTGAAQAVSLCLPEVKGKLTGMAFRIPVADVSAVDLTVRLSRATTLEEICAKMKAASEGDLKGILGYCDEELVSSDFLGTTHSGYFDARACMGLNENFYKLIAWYDNEMGYATRVVDLCEYIAKREGK